MNYQNVVCYGDSQTFGARSYDCYPMWLAKMLREKSLYQWRTINRSVNGYTARDLWFKINQEIDSITDTFTACVLIGTNDVGNNTSKDIFEEYMRQIILAFVIKKYKTILVGQIPPIFADGHAYFKKDTVKRRDEFNKILMRISTEFGEKVKFVFIEGLVRNDYEDPVHFNENGNKKVAEAFANKVISL